MFEIDGSELTNKLNESKVDFLNAIPNDQLEILKQYEDDDKELDKNISQCMICMYKYTNDKLYIIEHKDTGRVHCNGIGICFQCYVVDGVKYWDDLLVLCPVEREPIKCIKMCEMIKKGGWAEPKVNPDTSALSHVISTFNMAIISTLASEFSTMGKMQGNWWKIQQLTRDSWWMLCALSIAYSALMKKHIFHRPQMRGYLYLFTALIPIFLDLVGKYEITSYFTMIVLLIFNIDIWTGKKKNGIVSNQHHVFYRKLPQLLIKNSRLIKDRVWWKEGLMRILWQILYGNFANAVAERLRGATNGSVYHWAFEHVWHRQMTDKQCNHWALISIGSSGTLLLFLHLWEWKKNRNGIQFNFIQISQVFFAIFAAVHQLTPVTRLLTVMNITATLVFILGAALVMIGSCCLSICMR